MLKFQEFARHAGRLRCCPIQKRIALFCENSEKACFETVCEMHYQLSSALQYKNIFHFLQEHSSHLLVRMSIASYSVHNREDKPTAHAQTKWRRKSEKYSFEKNNNTEIRDKIHPSNRWQVKEYMIVSVDLVDHEFHDEKRHNTDTQQLHSLSKSRLSWRHIAPHIFQLFIRSVLRDLICYYRFLFSFSDYCPMIIFRHLSAAILFGLAQSVCPLLETMHNICTWSISVLSFYYYNVLSFINHCFCSSKFNNIFLDYWRSSH